MRLLAGLLAALLLIVVLTFVVRGCRKDALLDSYKRYVNDAGQVTAKSAAQGQTFAKIITNQAQDAPDRIQVQLRALARATEEVVTEAEALEPPDKLRGAHRSLLSALELRSIAVQSTTAQIKRIIDNQDTFSSNLLSQRIRRLLASDVIYVDNWAGPTTRILAEEGVSGVTVSNKDVFLREANTQWAAAAGAKELLPGLKRTTSTSGSGATPDGQPSGNRHGTALVSVTAVPEGKTLSEKTETILKSSENLQWEIEVENQGDFTEGTEDDPVLVRVSYATAGAEKAQTQEGRITEFVAKSKVKVTIPGPSSPAIDEAANLIVQVVALPAERVTTNNRAQFPIKIRVG